MNSAGRKLILHDLSLGTELGLVMFDSTGEKLTPSMVKMSDSNRNDLANLIPRMYRGGTSIGAGLLAGSQVI